MGSYFLISIFGSIIALIFLLNKPVRLCECNIPEEDKKILRDLINDYQNNTGDKIDPEEGRELVKRGVLEIYQTIYFFGFELKSCRHHSSNGLLITKNGYIVTCFHCIESGIDDLVVMDANGRSYPTEKICAYDEKEDIALIKCKMGTKKEHVVYKYRKNIYQNQLLTQLTRREGDIKIQGTHAIKLIILLPSKIDYLLSKTESRSGNSGGVIASIDGEIVSIIHGHIEDPKINNPALSIMIKKFIELIQQACQ